MIQRPPITKRTNTLFPYPKLFRALDLRRWIFGHVQAVDLLDVEHDIALEVVAGAGLTVLPLGGPLVGFVILRSEGAGMNDKIALLALPDLSAPLARLPVGHSIGVRIDRKRTRLNSSNQCAFRIPSSA